MNDIVIDEAIINKINDMLEDGELVLDEDGRIVDYRGVDIKLESASKAAFYGHNDYVEARRYSVEFFVGEALYKVVAQISVDEILPFGNWSEPDCKASLVSQNAYLLVYDAANEAWLVQGRCEWCPQQSFYQHANYLVREYISPMLCLPIFAA